MSTRSADLLQIARYTDQLLDSPAFTDWPGAVNGLQLENNGSVSRIAAAVDARLATFQLAIQAGADLLLVHHGLFWSNRQPWTGPTYQLLRLALDHNLAVYSSHLPLDAHPRLGNSALLARALGFRQLRPFFEVKGRPIGVLATPAPLPRAELHRRLALAVRPISPSQAPSTRRSTAGTPHATGAAHPREPLLLAGGPERCCVIGVVTGGAGAEIADARRAGVDTFITGEGPHWTAALADELGINVFYAGHYATETFGPRALAEHLARRFKLPWSFLDCPTGL